MRISRIYLDLKLIAGTVVSLDEEAAHYPLRVLRLRPGDGLSLFNENDGEFMAEVVEVERKTLKVRLLEPVTGVADPQLTIHLGLGLSRGERMDWAIQKATELGVCRISPLLTAHSEVRLAGKRLDNRLQHWRRIAISACEQCGRSRVPVVAEPVPLNDWLESHSGGFIFDPVGSDSLESLEQPQSINLVVGPEGGFDASELERARASDYLCVNLGPRVLRTETAPMVGLTLLQYLYGDLGAAGSKDE